MNTVHISPRVTQSIDLIARSLAKLAIPELTFDSVLVPFGHQMRLSLQKAGETGGWMTDSELFRNAAGHMARLGFLEVEPGDYAVGVNRRYRITDAGKLLVGVRQPYTLQELPAWWVRMTDGKRYMDFCLTDPLHVDLLCRFAVRPGWHVAGAPMAL